MSGGLTVACFLWDGEAADRRTRYSPTHVNALRRMVDEHLNLPHEFVCLTDDVYQAGFDDGVRLAEIPADVLGWGLRYPKLFLFSPRARQVIGSRYLCLDLDCVVVGDLTPLVTRQEPFVAWSEPSGQGHYNTSMVLMDAGARPGVWSGFDREIARRHTRRIAGTDQAWVSMMLGPGEATWDSSDGVLSYRRHCRGGLPEAARIVFFHGRPKPWDEQGWPLERWTA